MVIPARSTSLPRRGPRTALLAAALAFAVAGGTLLAPVVVDAHSGATGIVKMRMDAMKDIGEQMKLLAAMTKGQVRHDGARAAAAARVIGGHAAHIPEMFPEGSNTGMSEAAPTIWTVLTGRWRRATSPRAKRTPSATMRPSGWAR